MRIEWGSRGHTLNLGPYGTKPCAACQADRPFSVMLQYKYQYVLDPALSMVSERRYSVACDTCGQGWSLDTKIMERELKKNPIPWQHRYGLAVGGIAIAIVALLVGWLNHPTR
jgi:hypothetical protein